MHSYDLSNDVVLHYNSDMSGDMVLVAKENKVERMQFGGNVTYRVDIPAEALIEFVIMHLKNQKISNLEKMTVDQFIDSL